MANGVADNMLITTYLSMKAPVFIAPAMDLDMYKHPTTQDNMKRLQSFGNTIIEPKSGFLASGLEGKGRMEEPEHIVDFLDSALNTQTSMQNKNILITAGPTFEKIDPVRFIGNYSSGKMGFALARECALRGANVTLVAGPVSLETPHSAINRIDVESCEEMYEATIEHFKQANAAILCAAVADFKPENMAQQKIKREEDDLVIRLKPTHDIAAQLGKMKKEGQRLVGFALETNNEMAHAQDKLVRKNLDFIVLNSLRNEGTCFKSDQNKICIVTREGQKEFGKKNKQEVAIDIVNELEEII